MNPVSASLPNQPQPASPANANNITPDIVRNIPIHNQGAVPAHPVNDDMELDKIMQDVNHELKKADDKPAKHHFFELKHNHKSEANFSAQPRQVVDVRAQPAAQPAAHAAVPHPPSAAVPMQANRIRPAAQPAPKADSQTKPAKPPKPQKTHSTPILAILLTLIVTAGLTAAAYYSYK